MFTENELLLIRQVLACGFTEIYRKSQPNNADERLYIQIIKKIDLYLLDFKDR